MLIQQVAQSLKSVLPCFNNSDYKGDSDATVLIIDNFTGGSPHGVRVQNELEKSFNGKNIERFDVGGQRVGIKQLANGVEYGLNNYPNLVHINLSFGAGSTQDPDGLNHRRLLQLFRECWTKGISVTVSAGNSGDRVNGVSILAASPWTWAVGALDGQGNFAEFSQHFPRIVDAFAYGPWGTSGAAPYLGGSIAEVKRLYNLSNSEARTLFKLTSNPLKFRDNNPPKEFHYWKHDKEAYLDHDKPPYEIGSYLTIKAFYHVYVGRQPDAASFNKWLDIAETDGLEKTINKMKSEFKNSGDWMQDEVPVMDRIQAVFHLHSGREINDSEMIDWVDEVMSVNRDMTAFSMQKEKVSEYDTMVSTNGSYTNWADLIKGICNSQKEDGLRFSYLVDEI